MPHSHPNRLPLQELTDGLQLPTFLSGQAQLNDGSGFLRVSRINDTMTSVLVSRRAASLLMTGSCTAHQKSV